MPYLFKTFADIKSQLGGAVNQSIDINSIAPIIDDAYTAHIERYVPRSIVDTVNQQYQTNTLTSANADLLPFVQKALAMLAMSEYTKVVSVQISDAGIRRVESDNSKTAYKYQTREVRDYFLKGGYAAFENMLYFLHNNRLIYTAWFNTDEAIAHTRQVVPYAKDLQIYASYQIDRYTYQSLAPIVRDLQRQCFEDIVPKAFASGFLDRCRTRTLTIDEQQLRHALLRHIGASAIQQAQLEQIVTVEGGRVTVTEEYGDSNSSNRTTPNQSQAAYASEAWRRKEERLQQEWYNLIRNNPNLYPSAFDVASGGTNTDADAWHINTTAEQETQAQIDSKRLTQPVMLM